MSELSQFTPEHPPGLLLSTVMAMAGRFQYQRQLKEWEEVRRGHVLLTTGLPMSQCDGKPSTE